MLILSRHERELLPLVVSAPEVRIFEFTGQAFLFASFILRLASLLLFPFLAVLVAAREWPALRAADFHHFLQRPGARYPASQAAALTLLLGGAVFIWMSAIVSVVLGGRMHPDLSCAFSLSFLFSSLARTHVHTHTHTRSK